MKILRPQSSKRFTEEEYLAHTHKACGACKQLKSVDRFYRLKARTVRGWFWDTNCVECRNEESRKYAANSKPTRNKRLRQWRKSNPEKAAALDRRRQLKRDYNLTPEQVAKMREAQNNCCGVCHKKAPVLFVDHCHKTGKVRDLLCPACNTFLGWYEKGHERVSKFRRYVDKHTILLKIDFNGRSIAATPEARA